MLLRRLARPLLASAFVVDGVDTLMHPEHRVEAASTLLRRAGQTPGEPGTNKAADPALLVRVNAGAQVASGVLLALGRAPRAAALVLAATVIPAAVTEQDFWAEKDPERKTAKRAAFLKDVSLLGGLLIASADTEGKPSLGWRGRRAARNAAASVSAALPIGAASNGSTSEAVGERLHDTAVRARSLAGIAAAKGSEVAETAQAQGSKWAEIAKERGPEWAEAAQTKGMKAAERAQVRAAKAAERAQARAAKAAEQAQIRGAKAAEAAQVQAARLAEIAKERGPEWAEAAREREAELAQVVRERAPELSAAARKRGVHLMETVRDGIDARTPRS
ncbi:DoxX family membrane protein [Nocardia uniformis]|uniref:DoxX family membrane protein n=1 Tax=Nocardia uniformis TaxID=53432 RepID=A0A849BZB0_9NOCA|nr:DoxX family membrane protein [Nocardia uniformis]NNH70628.1 DoxX family membrane protein [Nocardia uniformis]